MSTTTTEELVVPDDLADLPETWGVHPEWNHLAVSTHGRVRNLNTGNLVGRMSGGTGADNPRYPRRKPRYLRVTVSSGRPQVNVQTHILVLETFVGPRPDDHDGDHINGDTLDNRLVNLRWLPSEENQLRHWDRFR